MKTFLSLLLTLLSLQVAQATHILGGYVQAKTVAGSSLTYEVSVVVYMNAGIAATSQATSLSVCFGDGNSGSATRINQQIISLDRKSLYSSINVSTYVINHAFAGPGTYTITTSLSNRTTSVNINDAAQQEPLTLTTTFSTISASNQTPSLSIPATGFDVALRQKTTLSLKATDVDGDSLVYGLAKPLTSAVNSPCTSSPIATYQFPNDLTHQGTYKLNNRTGELTWDAPTQQGYFSIAITVEEYRNGNLISQTIQEIPLIVEDLPGTPGSIPAYEPAIEGATDGIVTATTPYIDSNIVLTTFPSPVDDRLQIIIQASALTTATVELFDMNGRKVHELVFTRAAWKHEQVVSMSNLTPGFYILRADVSGRALVRKVMKR